MTHAVRIDLAEPLPAEVAVGGNVRARVAVSCATGCDLAGQPLVVIGPDGDRATYALGPREDAGNVTDIIVTAPAAVGQHGFHISTQLQKADDVVHAAATLEVTLTTRPHQTSLAVWGVPDVAVVGEAFVIKAGVKCGDGCALRGHRIDIVDADGAVLTSQQTGEAPWQGTSALYWTELTSPAPPNEGLVTLTARIEQTAQPLAHDAAASSFTLAIVKPPEHALSITVVSKDTAVPIAGADIRLGPYRATTDQSGRAELRIADGAYELHAWKAGYEAPTTALDIRADTAVQVAAMPQPEEDPDARWKM